MKPLSPPRLIKSRADLRREYASLARRLRNEPAAKGNARVVRRFNELGQVLRKPVPRHADMQAKYDAVYSEAIAGGVSRGKAHSHALGEVRQSFSISARQLQRVIIRKDYRPRRSTS